MPNKPRKPCKSEGCPYMTRSYCGFCVEHNPTRPQGNSRNPDKPLPKSPRTLGQDEQALLVAREGLCPAWAPMRREHYWLVDVDVLIEMEEFFERYRPAPPGWCWSVCRDCGKAMQLHREDCPPPGRLVPPRTFVRGVA